MKRVSIFLALVCVAFSAEGYRLLKKYPVPGDGGWDYLTVDSAARRIYVSHGTQVQVLDEDSGAVLASIPGKGVHGIALAATAGRGFITNGTGDSVTVFDLKTLQPAGEIPTGKKPDAILYDDFTRLVFANNADSGTSTAIDTTTAKAVGTVKLGGAPEASASDGKGFVFTNIEDKSELVKIDAKALKVVARWTLDPCQQPSALTIDRVSRRLYVGCRNKVMVVVDADSGKVVASAPIGDHVDAAVFDAATKTVFFSNQDGTMNVFQAESPDRVRLVETAQTGQGAKTMAFDPKTKQAFLATAEYGEAPAGKKGRAMKPGSFAVLVMSR